MSTGHSECSPVLNIEKFYLALSLDFDKEKNTKGLIKKPPYF